MKVRITLMFAICAIAISAIGQSKATFCKKWKVDIESVMKDLPPEMTAMFDMLPAEQKDMAMKQMMTSFENLWVVFNADGTMESVNDKGPVSGTWKFIDGNKAVYTKVGEEESEMEFVEFSADKMRIKQRNVPEGQPQMVLTFIPY